MFTYLLRTAVFGTALVASLMTSAARCASPEAIVSARRDVEIAELELRRYLNVAYPSQRDHFAAQMTLAKAEIEVQRGLVREYERMSRGKTSKPFLVTLADARLALLAAELSYQRNCDEKNRLEKFHSSQRRLYELRVEQARARLKAQMKASDR